MLDKNSVTPGREARRCGGAPRVRGAPERDLPTEHRLLAARRPLRESWVYLQVSKDILLPCEFFHWFDLNKKNIWGFKVNRRQSPAIAE